MGGVHCPQVLFDTLIVSHSGHVKKHQLFYKHMLCKLVRDSVYNPRPIAVDVLILIFLSCTARSLSEMIGSEDEDAGIIVNADYL